MKRYQVIYRRKSWQVCTLTINGTLKTVRRFDTETEAHNWVNEHNQQPPDSGKEGMEKMKTLDYIDALAKHLGCTREEAEEQREDYLVLTDEEADQMARDYILESAWAFKYNFLCGHSEAIAEIPQKDYEEMAGKLCESFNKAVLAMINDIDHFVDDAIACDGRGHFLSSYDGEENEENGYFIYKIN